MNIQQGRALGSAFLCMETMYKSQKREVARKIFFISKLTGKGNDKRFQREGVIANAAITAQLQKLELCILLLTKANKQKKQTKRLFGSFATFLIYAVKQFIVFYGKLIENGFTLSVLLNLLIRPHFDGSLVIISIRFLERLNG